MVGQKNPRCQHQSPPLPHLRQRQLPTGRDPVPEACSVSEIPRSRKCRGHQGADAATPTCDQSTLGSAAVRRRD